MKTKIINIVLAIFCLVILKGQAQETDAEHVTNLKYILKKPVPTGSTLRYEKLVEYINTSLDKTEAANVLADINAKNPFGKCFYERLSHSTVDKKILPLLKNISEGRPTEIAEEKSQKVKPKNSSTTRKKDNSTKKVKTGAILEMPEINMDNIYIVQRFPFTVALPNKKIYKNISEDDIMNAVFQNQPDGVSFEQVNDYIWQLKFAAEGKTDKMLKIIEFIQNKDHYFVPHLSRELYEIDRNQLWVYKKNKDEFLITYAKNIQLGFSQLELIHAITKHDKLPEGMNISDFSLNQWTLKISRSGIVQTLIDKTIGFDISEFEEDFAKKIIAAAK